MLSSKIRLYFLGTFNSILDIFQIWVVRINLHGTSQQISRRLEFGKAQTKCRVQDDLRIVCIHFYLVKPSLLYCVVHLFRMRHPDYTQTKFPKLMGWIFFNQKYQYICTLLLNRAITKVARLKVSKQL